MCCAPSYRYSRGLRAADTRVCRGTDVGTPVDSFGVCAGAGFARALFASSEDALVIAASTGDSGASAGGSAGAGGSGEGVAAADGAASISATGSGCAAAGCSGWGSDGGFGLGSGAGSGVAALACVVSLACSGVLSGKVGAAGAAGGGLVGSGVMGVDVAKAGRVLGAWATGRSGLRCMEHEASASRASANARRPSMRPVRWAGGTARRCDAA